MALGNILKLWNFPIEAGLNERKGPIFHKARNVGTCPGCKEKTSIIRALMGEGRFFHRFDTIVGEIVGLLKLSASSGQQPAKKITTRG